MDNLYFSQGDKLLIDGKECIVLGSINFLNKADNCTWTEYKLRSTRENKIYWLSVDTTYDEYAIYEQCRYSNEFTQENILNAGYKKADYGRAQVREYSGNVDVDIGEWVEFSEFEDFSEERIISIESWEDETEYSKGYYLDKNQISLINNGNYNYEDNYNNDSNDYYEVSHTSFSSNFKGH